MLMAEYCEYMWEPSRFRGWHGNLYQDYTQFDKKDKKLAIKTVRCILRDMPNVDLKNCTDEYITRFLLARKYRIEQTAALIAAYQAQIAHRPDIFGNLTARDPAIQRALRAGIPGVLPARDRKGRCVLVILSSQWDPVAVPALSVQRAIFLVLETLIEDPRNQEAGFVCVVDWSGFSLRQGGALGAAAVRNLIAALRGRFPARFKAIHFLSAPLYVQATLAFVKPFLDEKMRSKIYLHGNNMTTLHKHLPTDILPAELGGTGPAFNPGLWAEPVIHSAMKEAELAAIKKEQMKDNDQSDVQNSEVPIKVEITKHNEKCDVGNGDANTESKTILKLQETKDKKEKQFDLEVRSDPEGRTSSFSTTTDDDLSELQSETNSNEFEIITNCDDNEDSFLDVRIDGKSGRNDEKEDLLPEEKNLIS